MEEKTEGEYLPTIGLEVHAELKTLTKMFCDSRNDPDEERPNVNVCPVCMAHPGTLPVINKEAVRHILRVGTALGGKIAEYTEFDRKNYFYPDIPKGYQISQYKYPLISGGKLRGVEITRVHLEEDTARSTHQADRSLIDFNRAGVPLMELVTEPVIHSVEDAVAFAKELQLLLRTLGAGDANMEKGEMRIEANISVAKAGNEGLNQPEGLVGRTDLRSKSVLGTKVEVKNLNSFRAVERAILYEVKRQSALLERGEKVTQETRGWDDTKEETYSQRLKEDSHDYRYFPDPDLPSLNLSEIDGFSIKELKKSLPELPWERRERYLSFGLKNEDAEQLAGDLVLAHFFDGAIEGKKNEFILKAANYTTSDLAGLKLASSEEGTGKLTSESFRTLIEMTLDGDLSSRGAKDTLAILFEKGGGAREAAEFAGLIQKSGDEYLREIAQKVIDAHKLVAEEYLSGKEASLQFLVGQGMKESRGAANPELLKEILIKEIKK